MSTDIKDREIDLGELTDEQKASWEKRKDMWMKIMDEQCYDMQDGDFPLWGISCLQNSMEKLFNDAQETICINGKEQLVYKSFKHWIEIKTQNQTIKINNQ